MKSWLAVVVLYALVNPNLLPAREATPAKILSQLPPYVDRLMADWNVPGRGFTGNALCHWLSH